MRPSRLPALSRLAPLALPALLAAACTAGDPAATAGTEPLVHTFPAIELEPFEERTGDCQSWTLDNDEPLVVNAVTMSADPGWHHSNWMYVPESQFEGPDGTWPCGSRDYDEVQAGFSGGVLYAQSTQVTGETQQFPAGSGLLVPARSKVVARVHVVNVAETPLSTALSLTLQPIPDDGAVTRLRPFVLSYFPLDIPPQQESQFAMRCDAAAANGGDPLDFSIYYVLAHYHQWGTRLFFEAQTGGGTVVVFDEENAIGDPLGLTLDPPVSLAGATSLDFGCRYENLSDQPVGFENDDGGEMCMMLAYGDDTRRWIGGAYDVPNLVLGTDGEGVLLNEAECTLARL